MLPRKRFEHRLTMMLVDIANLSAINKAHGYGVGERSSEAVDGSRSDHSIGQDRLAERVVRGRAEGAVDRQAIEVPSEARPRSAPCDTVGMRSVADDLRRDTVERILAMSVANRIRLALDLGDADADRYAQAAGRSLQQARQHLAARRHVGRTPSRCASSAP
ncbi:MAG: hypothetical protein K2Y23_01395 [Cyanobacteria bacterium]|nr:hypothetical protein [Cyanobacteriota bacterium]